MPVARTNAALDSLVSGFARGCAAALMVMAFSSLSVAAGGTVAVTGDGTSAATPLKPTVGDGNAATGTDDGTSKKKKKSAKKSAPASDDSETETASREMSVPTGGAHAIVALVNDEPVTGFEIEQRAMMLSGSEVQNQAKAVFESIIKNPKTSERLKGILKDVVKANEGKSRDEIIAIFEKRKKEFGMSLQKQAFDTARAGAMPAVRKQALEELIDERLKVQEAKKQSVTIEDADVDRIVKGIAERNKMTLDQFAKQLGGSIDPIKTRIRATLAWNEVVRRRFGPLININAKDVDKLVATTALGTSDAVELQVQLVSVSMPAKREDAEIAQRIQEADKLRSKFSDCKSTEGIVAGVAGAKFEDLGKRRPSIFPEPTRSMLLNASDGEMLPPRVGDSAIELWVVCGHTALKAEDEKRTTAENELKQKEFEVMAKRYLKDLREDAHIEYR